MFLFPPFDVYILGGVIGAVVAILLLVLLTLVTIIIVITVVYLIRRRPYRHYHRHPVAINMGDKPV